MTDIDCSTWLSVRRAADAAQVSRRSIYIWLDKGLVEYTRTAGGQLRINPASLFAQPTREWRKDSERRPA